MNRIELLKKIEIQRNILVANSKRIYEVYGDGYPFTGSQYINDMSDSCCFKRAEKAHRELGRLLMDLDTKDNKGIPIGYMDL